MSVVPPRICCSQKVVLEREADELSYRYAVVRREIVWRSPIMLTPFTAHGTIDAEKLGAFIERCYRDAGVQPDARAVSSRSAALPSYC